MSGRKLSEDTEAESSVHPDNTSTVASSTTTSQAEPRKEIASLALSDPPKGLAASPQIKEDPRARKPEFGSHALMSQEAGGQAPAAPAVPAETPAGDQEKKANGVKTTDAVVSPAKPTPAASETPAKPADEDVKKASDVKAVQTPAKPTPAKSTPAPSLKPVVSARSTAPAVKEPAGVPKTTVSEAPTKKVTDKELVMSPDPVSQPKASTKPAITTTPHPPTTPKAAKSNTAKKSLPASVSPAFVKPRPKSPTRPVKLPASLTTHTTASGSRSRVPSGTAPPSSHEHSARSASRTKAIGRSSSAAGRQRPSVGPPPKLPAKDHPVVKKDAKVDEGFLARMMRPTAASASKKNEKVPVTPPRRTAAASKKSASAKSIPTRRPVSKTTSTTTSAAPSPERIKKESSADRDIATVIQRMSIAEQETPKTPEREATIAEELEEEKSSAAPEVSKEPEVSATNGNHKGELEGHTSAGVLEGKSQTEQAATNVRALDDEETW